MRTGARPTRTTVSSTNRRLASGFREVSGSLQGHCGEERLAGWEIFGRFSLFEEGTLGRRRREQREFSSDWRDRVSVNTEVSVSHLCLLLRELF